MKWASTRDDWLSIEFSTEQAIHAIIMTIDVKSFFIDVIDLLINTKITFLLICPDFIRQYSRNQGLDNLLPLHTTTQKSFNFRRSNLQL